MTYRLACGTTQKIPHKGNALLSYTVRVKNVRTFLVTYAAPMSFASVAIAAIVMGIFVTTWDMSQLVPSTSAIINGDFSNVYPAGTGATSLPAWMIFIGPFFAFFDLWLPDYAAWPTAGILVLPILFVSVRYTVRVFHPACSNERAWVFAAAATLLPSSLAALFEYYHPQDLAATALTLLGMAFLFKKRWLPSALMFAIAILTRQWVILPLIAIFPFSYKHWWKFALTTGGVVAAVCAPFFLIGNPGFIRAAVAESVAYKPQTLIGFIIVYFAEGEQGLALTIVRSVPVIVACILAIVVLIKKMPVEYMIPVAITSLVARTFFESVPYVYYWAPALILLAIMSIERITLAISAFALGGVLLFITYTSDWLPVFIAVGLWIVINATTILLAWSKWEDTETNKDSDRTETGAVKPMARSARYACVVVAIVGFVAYVALAPFYNPDIEEVDPTREMGDPIIVQMDINQVEVNP
jgi:hypothetical protein